MDKVSIVAFLRALDVKKVSVGEMWVTSSCPLASVFHSKGEDKHPSFGVKIDPSGESFYRCFVCGGGTLDRLLHNLYVCGLYNAKAIDIYSRREVFGEKPSGVISDLEYKPSVPTTPVPEDVLDGFPVIVESHGFEARRMVDYFEGRNISFGSLKKYQIRYSPHQQLIVFPRIDADGNVYSLRARSRKQKSYFTMSASYFFDSRKWGDNSLWFGEQFMNRDEPLLMVESETDVLRLDSLKVTNMVGCCGNLQKAQIDRVSNDTFLAAFDADNPGMLNFKRAKKYLWDKAANLFALDWAEVGCNDAGDLIDLNQFKKVRGNKVLISKHNRKEQSYGK
jgi:DNA primase